MADPTGSISGCFWWLESDSGVYKDAGSTLAADTETVQQWNDQSGAGNHATQATSGKRPVYRTNQINGLPSLRFDASDDALQGPAKSSGALTLFIVCNTRASGGTGNHRAVGGSNNWLLGPYGGLFTSFMAGFAGNTKDPVVEQDFQCVCITQNGTTGKLYHGNIDRTVANATGFPGTMYLGGGSGAFVEPLNGDIAAVVAYDSVLSSSDRALVFNYLAAKYNVPGLTSPTEPVADVTGCVLHLDAAEAAYKDAALAAATSDGDAVYQWLDKAGRGWRAIQATGSKQPLYKTNIINGLPVMRFDGTDDVLPSGHYLERPYTVFIVYKKHGAGSGNQRAIGGGANWFIGNGAGLWRHFAGSNYVAGFTEVVDQFILGTATNNGSTSSFHINETDRTSDSSPIGNCQQMFFGAQAASEFFNGDIAEILVYNSALSSGDRRKVWDYLGPKYELFASSVAAGPPVPWFIM